MFREKGLFIVAVLATLLVTCIFVVVSAKCSFAQGSTTDTMQNLLQSTKLRTHEAIMAPFLEGELKTRVIVSLREPSGFRRSPDLRHEESRRHLSAAVRDVQNRFLPGLDENEIRPTNQFTYLFGFSAEVTLEGIRRLEGAAEVVSIEADGILHAHPAQGVPLMNASVARSAYSGAGISIAICDTGIDYRHPRLGGGGFPNAKVIGGYDCGDNDNDPMDAQGHGTCCAGIAAGGLGATGDYIGGVAHGAKLYAVKIAFGSGGSAYGSDMIEGWEWCITHQNDDPNNPILIISTSFGGSKFIGYCDSDSPSMTNAAANAAAAGITLFASSGNDGYCNAMGWPACISHVISVGAVYDAAFGTYYPCVSEDSCAAKFSSTGCSTGWYAIDNTAADRVTSYSNSATFLTLFAPSNAAYTTDITGGGGYSPDDYYPSFGGTSAACPYAAGAAAVLQQATRAVNGSYLTPAEVKSCLIATGNAVTDSKVAITKPRVNLQNAINYLQGSEPSESNDDFADAIRISGSSGLVTGSNVIATKEAGEPNHAGNLGGKSVWWKWTAPSSGTVNIDTHGSDFDTILAVYRGTSVSNLTEVASNDDDGSANYNSGVSFGAVNGVLYYIAVDGYYSSGSADSGNLVLNHSASVGTDSNANILSVILNILLNWGE